MNIKVVEDAISTYEQIKKDLEGYLGKITSGSETAAEEVVTAIKERIVNIRDFLVPSLKAELNPPNQVVPVATVATKTTTKASVDGAVKGK